jgi:bifunctional UDP-N-acetylglucosamine pyrophosphorylase/glucosamine-1-phosphate N-acetyltransferase
MTEEKILKEKEIWEELGKKEKRAQILARLGEGGVIIVDLEHTYIESKVRIGRGTLILPNVFIFSNTVIGEKCIIWSSSVIIDSRIGNFVAIESFSKIERAETEDDVTIRSHSKVAEGSRLRKGCKIGPQACLRPGTIVDERIDIGKAYI